MIWTPVRSLGEVAEERKVLPGFVAVTLYAALGLILQAVFVFGGAMEVPFGTQDMQPPPGTPTEIFENVVVAAQVATLISAVLGPFVRWIVVSLVLQLVTSLFRGTGPLSAMFAAVGVAFVPLAALTALQIPLGGLQVVLGPEATGGVIAGLISSLLSLGGLIWHVVLVVIGAALARGIGYGESTGSCALSCGGCSVLVALIWVVVIGGIAALADAFGQ
jgi:hypothetical protein